MYTPRLKSLPKFTLGVSYHFTMERDYLKFILVYLTFKKVSSANKFHVFITIGINSLRFPKVRPPTLSRALLTSVQSEAPKKNNGRRGRQAPNFGWDTSEWASCIIDSFWQASAHQAHIALSEPMSNIDQQGSSLGSFLTFPSLILTSGYWPCVEPCLVGDIGK